MGESGLLSAGFRDSAKSIKSKRFSNPAILALLAATSTTSSSTPLNKTTSQRLHNIIKMGFTDLLSDAGLTVLNNWLLTRSYVTGYVLISPPP